MSAATSRPVVVDMETAHSLLVAAGRSLLAVPDAPIKRACDVLRDAIAHARKDDRYHGDTYEGFEHEAAL